MMKVEHAKIIFKSGGLKSVIAAPSPLSKEGWEIIVTTAEGEEHVIETFRGQRRMIKDLNAVYRVIRSIGFRRITIGEF